MSSKVKHRQNASARTPISSIYSYFVLSSIYYIINILSCNTLVRCNIEKYKTTNHFFWSSITLIWMTRHVLLRWNIGLPHWLTIIVILWSNLGIMIIYIGSFSCMWAYKHYETPIRNIWWNWWYNSTSICFEIATDQIGGCEQEYYNCK